jgi:hypothetical protein
MAGALILAGFSRQVSLQVELRGCEGKLTASLQSQHLQCECLRHVEGSRASETPVQYRSCDFLRASKCLRIVVGVLAIY